MDFSDLNSIVGAGSGASSIATALAPKAKSVTAKDTTNPTTDGSTSTTDNSTITANDFLTLLVAELQNQDPTQPTDPTQYIQQLVGVNSLQQLISINQGMTNLDNAVIG
jgi:flagellar basal-body rod modification protein FlgD